MATGAQEPKGNGGGLVVNDFDWQREELKQAIRDAYAKGATDAQFLVFLEECKRRNAIPGKHIYFRLQRQREMRYDPEVGQMMKQWVEKAIHITSIDFFRLTAQRTGEYAGQKRLAWYYLDAKKEPTIRREAIPDAQMEPYAAEATVLRKGFQEPLVRTARWEAFVQTFKGDDGKYRPNPMWQRMGPEMLAKCAEAQALRAAFPEELAGLYIGEEIPDAEPEPQNNGTRPTAAPPQPLSLPAATTDASSTTAANPQPKSESAGAASPPVAGNSDGAAPAPPPTEKKSGFAMAEELQTKDELVEALRSIGRNILEPAGVKDASGKVKRFILACANKQKIKDVKDEQLRAIYQLLAGAHRKNGVAGVIAVIDEKLAEEKK